MYTKTVIAAAALVASVAAYDLPQCWSTCFGENNVVSQGCICKDGTREAVSSCIATGCSAEEASTYEGWASDYCDAPIPSSVPIPASSSYYPASSSAHYYPVSSSSYAAPASSEPAHSYPAPPPHSYPAGSSVYPSASASASYSHGGYPVPSGSASYYPVPSGSEGSPVPSGYASGSAGGYPVPSVSAGPVGYPSGSASYGPGGYGTAAASTGYPVASSYAGPYATGAAAPMATAGAGFAMIVGGIAAALL